MHTTVLVIGIAILIIGIFVLAISLTLIIKGKNIASEIGDNKHMRDLGITCAKHQIYEEERALRGDDCETTVDCDPKGCGTCSPTSHK